MVDQQSAVPPADTTQDSADPSESAGLSQSSASLSHSRAGLSATQPLTGSNLALTQSAAAVAAARVRLSITTKIIMAVVVLVIIVVGLFSVLGAITQGRIYQDLITRSRSRGATAARKQLGTLSRRLTLALAPALADNNYPYLREVVARTVADDANIVYITVATEAGKIAVDSRKGMANKMVKDPISKRKKREYTKTLTTPRGKALLYASPMMTGGTLQGEIRVLYSLAFLAKQLAEYGRDRERANKRLLLQGVTVAVGALLLGALLAILIAVSITRPIKALAYTANQLAAGNLTARTGIATSDEVGQLGLVLDHMAVRLTDLVAETATKAQLKKEMEVAAAVQDALVPGPQLIDLDVMNIAGFYRPADICGGDWWNLFHVDERRTLLVIGDVTGHGVSSAMLTASAKSSCDALTRELGPRLSVLGLMQALNHVIFEAGRGRLLMTCGITLIDRKTGDLEFASAAHPLPYIVSMSSGRPKLRSLVGRGNRLGDREDWNFTVQQNRLEPDEMILWYTDGLTEGMNPRGVEYGEKRVRQTLKKQVETEAHVARDRLAKHAYDFYDSVPQGDDITFVVGKMKLNSGNHA